MDIQAWLQDNLVTIIVSGLLPIILLFLQKRKTESDINKIKSESNKINAESEKIEAETESIEIKNTDQIVALWQGSYKELKDKYDVVLELNKANSKDINILQDTIAGLKSKQRVVVDFVHNVLESVREPRPDIFCIIDEKKLCQYISPNVFEILGYSPLDFFNKDRTDIIHPDDRAMFERVFFHTLQFPEVANKLFLRVKRADGEYIWMESTIMNLLRTHVRGIFFSSRDITKIRVAEEDFKKLSES